MAELIGVSGYDTVQDTAPSNPSIGDTWLDTSTDPPTGKIYADLGGGGQWTTDLLDAQISSRSSHGDPDPNNYLDARISNRLSTSDVDSVVSDRFLDKDMTLDPGVSPTQSHYSNTYLDATGSGFIVAYAQNVTDMAIELDGAGPYSFQGQSLGPLPFGSSVTVTGDGSPGGFNTVWAVFH